MANISKIKLPLVDTPYDIYDAGALHDATAFDAAGAAATVKAEVIGANGDASSASTIYGAKKYADEKVAGLGAVLNFKGVKNTKADVDAELNAAKVGDVWLCKADNSEYVCVADSDGSNKRFEKLGFDVRLEGYVTKGEYNDHTHTVTMAGSNQASAVSGTASFAENKVVTSATSANLAVSKTGTVAFTGDHTSKSALGANATFTTEVDSTTTNIKATATGTALSTNGDTIKPVINVGSPTEVTLPTITDSTWTFTYNNGTLEIGGKNGSHTSGSVTAGSAPTLGDNKTFLTSASVQTQPTIALTTEAAAGAGVVSVVTGIGDVTTAVDTADTVSAITGLGTLSDTIDCELNGAASSGVAYVSGVNRDAVSGTISGTAAAQTWAQGNTTVSTPV